MQKIATLSLIFQRLTTFLSTTILAEKIPYKLEHKIEIEQMIRQKSKNYARLNTSLSKSKSSISNSQVLKIFHYSSLTIFQRKE